MRVLIVEDETRIAYNIQKVLRENLIVADIRTTADEAEFQAETQEYDVIILDWMLPDKSGAQVCFDLRQKNLKTPILMLTAKSQIEDKVSALNKGADDYLTKPFSMRELVARIKALIRRGSGVSESPILRLKPYTINTNTCEVTCKGKMISLAPKEYSLLEYLARNKNHALTRIDILSHVWGEETDEFSNTVDVHIRYLRKKLKDHHPYSFIKTVKNKGYMVCHA